MATLATTLWTVATVRTYVGITDADTSKDTALERIANGVTAFIERHTRRLFVTRSVTESRDGDGSKILYLYNYPLTAFTSLKVLRSPTDSAMETVATADYEVNLKTGKVWLHADRLTRGVGNVEAVYSTGYGAQGATTLPPDIVDIGLQLCKMQFVEETIGAAGQASITIGAHTISINPSWPKQIKDTLDNWRRPY